MQSIQLYLNSELADLSDDTPIALTFQINTLADVKNQNGNTSNQFKLPLTQRNRRILGFPDDIKVTTNIPYTQLSALVIQDGIQVIQDGLAEISSVDDQSASVTILSGNVDFFDRIDGPIYEMGDSTKESGKNKPFAPYNHIWNINNAVNSRNNTSGYIYPVINYGNLNPLQPYIVNVRDLRPAFFLHTAIDLIVKQTGYKAIGSLLTDPLYNKILIPFANDSFEHGTDYQTQPDELGILAYTAGDKAVSHNNINDNKGFIAFTNEQSDPKGQFDGNNFIAQQIFTGEVLLTVPRFYFKGRVTNSDTSYVKLQIWVDAPEGQLLYELVYDLTSDVTVIQQGPGIYAYKEFETQKLSAEIDFQVGYKLYVKYEFFGAIPANFILYSGASLQIKSKNTDVIFGQQVQCERIFPDISQKDLLKDTLQRFGIICQTDNTNKTVNFASFRDIVKNIPVARDWSSKHINTGMANEFKLGNYAKVNYLKYKEDEAVTSGYADDVITVDNATLPASVELFTGQFAPSLNSPFVGGNVALIRKIDQEATDNSFTISTAPRILVDQKLNLQNDVASTSVTFTDGSTDRVINDTISTPYFYKQNGEFSLMWKDVDGKSGLRSLYYKELERILTRTKRILRYFLLTPRDIMELDLLVPVYLERENAYFYISKIDSWRKGQATKVELVKIGEI